MVDARPAESDDHLDLVGGVPGEDVGDVGRDVGNRIDRRIGPAGGSRWSAARLRRARNEQRSRATTAAAGARQPAMAEDACAIRLPSMAARRRRICITPTGARQRKMAIAFEADFSALFADWEGLPGHGRDADIPACARAVAAAAGRGAARPPAAARNAPAERRPTSGPPPVDNESIEGRRRPGYTGPLPDAVTQNNPGAVRAPPPEAFPTDQIPIPTAGG